MTFRQLKWQRDSLEAQLKDAERKLGVANRTIYEQLEELKAKDVQFTVAVGKLNKLYESQLTVQDKTINRLQIIVHYLEESVLKALKLLERN